MSVTKDELALGVYNFLGVLFSLVVFDESSVICGFQCPPPTLIGPNSVSFAISVLGAGVQSASSLVPAANPTAMPETTQKTSDQARRFQVALFVALWLFANLPVDVMAQDSAAGSKREVAQAAPIKTSAPVAAPSTAGPGKALGELFARAGAVTCAPRVEQVGDFLLQGGEAGVFLFLPESAVDQRQIGLALEIVSPVGPGSNSVSGSPSAYASADFSPSVDGTCGASYQAIAYWPGNCAEVAKTRFSANKSLGVVKRNILMLELSKLGRIFLMPAGSGCVSIKRELLP
jgi:hypothetical protein